jgi:hypothetical protein
VATVADIAAVAGIRLAAEADIPPVAVEADMLPAAAEAGTAVAVDIPLAAITRTLIRG